jgi:hypothetical protein
MRVYQICALQPAGSFADGNVSNFVEDTGMSGLICSSLWWWFHFLFLPKLVHVLLALSECVVPVAVMMLAMGGRQHSI